MTDEEARAMDRPIRKLSYVFVGSFLLWGCAGPRLQVGANESDSGSGAGGSAPSSPGACQAAPDLSMAGTWEGYVENYAFFSGSDAVRVVIGGTNAGSGVCGTVTLGQGTPPPLGSDPDVGYPSDLDSRSELVDDLPANDFKDYRPAEGFAYEMLNGSVEGKRVRFQLAYGEFWKGWCGLQRTTYWSASFQTYSCAPDFMCFDRTCFVSGGTGAGGVGGAPPDSSGGSDLEGGTGIQVDFVKAALCGNGDWTCACNVTSCTWQTRPSLTFDVQFDVLEASGSVMLSSTLHNVHLHRVN